MVDRDSIFGSILRVREQKKKAHIPKSFNIKDIPWQTIIDAFSETLLQSRGKVDALVEGGIGETEFGKRVRLDKEIAMMRLVLVENLRRAAKGRPLDAKFLTRLLRALERSEELTKLYDVEMELWIQFLVLVVEKMKSERLITYDRLGGAPGIDKERILRGELEKMKKIMEER